VRVFCGGEHASVDAEVGGGGGKNDIEKATIAGEKKGEGGNPSSRGKKLR